MALITFAQIDADTRVRYAKRLEKRAASAVLNEEVSGLPITHHFDVFLSHSYRDAKMNQRRLLGVKAHLESFNLSVYVDWIIDRELDREKVTAVTAYTLRQRMDHSSCLFFVTSETSMNSRWMPWELGYMDGVTRNGHSYGRVAILPLVDTPGRQSFAGQEYLGIYPYVDEAESQAGDGSIYLWVNRNATNSVKFSAWRRGAEP
jgi:hypothetical protein